MKYKSEKTLRRAKKAFSLIELMIVIVIIGALTAIILPQFDISEAEAKDAGCDASNYGTLAQLTKFRSLHGVYPSNMHTGLETNEDDSVIMGGLTYGETGLDDDGATDNATMPSFTAANMANSTATTLALLTDTADDSYATSMKEAGMIALAYGGFPKSVDDISTATAIAFSGVDKAYVATITGNWYEEWTISDTTGKATSILNSTTGTPISINGIPLPFYIYNDAQAAFALAQSTDVTDVAENVDDDTPEVEEDGIVVPLFLAPTVDWEHWYDANGSENDSKIQVAQVGQCPWLEANAEFRFYIGVFKVYADGSKAKLLGTMCPEGGSLNP